MNKWYEDAIVPLFFFFFMLCLFIGAIGSDLYGNYQRRHTFEVVYETTKNCRLEVAKTGASSEYVNKICDTIPKWEDYK